VCGDALPALVTECDFDPCLTAGGSAGYARLAVMLVLLGGLALIA
jgi:hypothetical protein